ncbi:hypothetical protein, partial [uncultured Barnesiella sp.]|uniref:hypothetical protein n=1 Tax=uncultured Barnesiella sp. TaxID=584861 RepID=UPI00260B87EE
FAKIRFYTVYSSGFYVDPKYSEDTKLFRNSAKGIYLLEIKMVREFTSFLGNGLATVLIVVVRVALLVRVTLTDANVYK